jgi:bifunctional non-homologous end joining protein LigD
VLIVDWVKILGAMQTPDGRYRVEIVQRGKELSYRLLRDGQVWHNWAAIGSIQFFLEQDGVSVGDLVEAPITTAS